MATTANDFIQAYLADERLGAIGGFFRNNKLAKANAKGLTGSFTSLAACASFQHSERPHLFILPDKEEAAYFLNDMERIIGE